MGLPKAAAHEFGFSAEDISNSYPRPPKAPPARSAAVVNGPYGLNEARFWLTIHPLLVLSLVIALIANWRERTKRFLIGSTLIVYLVVLVVSALFFVPELIAFHDSPITAGDWQPRADRWWNLSLLRGTTLFIFAIPLLFARARSEASNGGN